MYSIAFFISCTSFFSSRISLWFYFLWFTSNFSCCLFIVFQISLNCFSVSSCISLGLLKTAVLNSFLGKSQTPCVWDRLLEDYRDPWWCHVSLIFHVPWSLHCCLHMWGSSYLLLSLPPALGRETPAPALLGILRLCQAFHGHTCSVLPAPSCGRILKLGGLLSVLQLMRQSADSLFPQRWHRSSSLWSCPGLQIGATFLCMLTGCLPKPGLTRQPEVEMAGGGWSTPELPVGQLGDPRVNHRQRFVGGFLVEPAVQLVGSTSF